MEIMIILAKCAKCGKLYGIRVQQTDEKKWKYTWAFPISEKTAEAEGFEEKKADGRIVISSSFPGCPHCSSPSFFKCECDKLTCWDGVSEDVECSWCGTKSRVQGSITNLAGGKF